MPTATSQPTPPDVAVLTGLAIAFVLSAALSDGIAQDWLPFRVAATLAPSSRWSEIYPDAGAGNLFSVPETFRDLTAAQLTADGPFAIPADAVTAFVSPPPAAFLLTPLVSLPPATALLLSRLALVLPLAITMVAFRLVGLQNPKAARVWIAMCVVAAPFIMYTVDIGQPSAWFFPVAVASMFPVLWLEVIGGVALGLLIVTKGAPLLIAVGLLLLGRHRIAAIGLGLAAAAVLVTWPYVGIDGWRRFAIIAARIGSSTISDWNNASVDAEVSRLVAGQATNAFVSAGRAVGVLAAAMKTLAVAGTVWFAWRARNPVTHVSAMWVVWLLVSPLVWLHYLIVLIPIAGHPPSGRSAAAIAGVASLSVPLVLRAFGFESLTIGHVATALWLATACLLVWPARATFSPTSAR